MPTTPRKKPSAAEAARRKSQPAQTTGLVIEPASAPVGATPVSKWKKKGAAIELQLPSDNVCLLKRPGLPQLLADNILPDLLTPIAQQAVVAGEEGGGISDEQSKEMMDELLKKEGGMAVMFDSFARITAHCVIEPQVLYHKVQNEEGIWTAIPDHERNDDVLYTDDVDLEDQMFIFNYVVGGSKDLTRFRSEFGESLDGLAAISGTS